MRRFIRLVGVFAVRQMTGTSAALLFTLIVALVFVGLLTGARMQSGLSVWPKSLRAEDLPSLSIASIDVGSVHRQVWDTTNYLYLGLYPGGILLPLRLASRWLFIILPFVGLLLASRSISQELESGLAQTLYVSPIRASTLGMARMLGDCFGTFLMIWSSLAVALTAAGALTHLTVTIVELVRSLTFIAILGVYTSIFVLIANLLSVTLRSSVRSVWACIVVALLVFTVHLTGENSYIAAHRSYPTIPFPPREVNEYLYEHDVWLTGEIPTLEELTADATTAVYRYLLNLKGHAQMVFDMFSTDYQRERWYGLISPAHAMWEVASQLLQDRHQDATEIFSPVSPLDPPPSLAVSVQRVWPELAGILVVWVVLFGVNVRVLSRLEV